MGRPRTPLNTIADAKSVRDRLKNKSLPGWQRQRLIAVQLGLAGKLSLPAIAEEAKTSARTVGTWFDTFRARGVDALLSRRPKGKGPKSWLDEKTALAFRAQLARGRCHHTGEARTWLEGKLKRKLSLVVTYKYLARLRNGAEEAPESHARNHSAPRQKAKARKGK
jgi:transposase